MLLKKLIQKAIVGGEWLIAYRDRHADSDKQYRFAGDNLPKDQWVADPFLFEKDGICYLFCEQYETKLNRAGIGIFVFENGVPRNRGIIIRRPYHMSYPCVFEYNNTVYMIPETSANRSVELYRAVEFPYKWELDTVLISNAEYVDSTVYTHEEGLRVLSYTKKGGKNVLSVFSLDMEEKRMQLLYETEYAENVARPAGNLFSVGNGLFRPAQDCSSKYGEAILIYTVNEFTESRLTEHCVRRVTVDELVFPGKAERIHTYNRNEMYEVVDLFRERIDLLHGWEILKRKYFHAKRGT